MIFTKTQLPDVYIIEIERHSDERGYFARTFCQDEFHSNGIETEFVQTNLSFNKKKGTLRGMHFQQKPYEEDKLILCTKGAIYDVIIDLRTDSPTYKNWISVELSEQSNKLIYIPKGFAHGFQTLEDNTILIYQMGEFYKPEFSRGIKWNDPAFQVIWPLSDPIVSVKDTMFPVFDEDNLR